MLRVISVSLPVVRSNCFMIGLAAIYMLPDIVSLMLYPLMMLSWYFVAHDAACSVLGGEHIFSRLLPFPFAAIAYLFKVHHALGLLGLGFMLLFCRVASDLASESSLSVGLVSAWLIFQAFLWGFTPLGWFGFLAAILAAGTYNHGIELLAYVVPCLLTYLWIKW